MNRRLLGILRALPGDVDEARRLLAHLLAARMVWRLRLQGEDTSAVKIRPDRSWDACQVQMDEAAYEARFEAMADADLDRVASYRNSKAIRYETAVRDVLQHLVVHGGAVTTAARWRASSVSTGRRRRFSTASSTSAKRFPGRRLGCVGGCAAGPSYVARRPRRNPA